MPESEEGILATALEGVDADVIGGIIDARRLVTGAACTTVLLIATACGGTTTRTASDDTRIPDCEELSEEMADLVVAVAEHAATGRGGLPAAALEAEHPEDFDAWEIAAALAEGSEELKARVASAEGAANQLGCPRGPVHAAIETRVQDELSDRGEQLSDDFDRDQYTAMNLMAIASAAFRPAPSRSANLPSAFPAEFPVHPDAELVDADTPKDGPVRATWQVEDEFGDVADFYLDALQEGRLGGWDVPGSHGAESQDVDGVSTGRQLLEITGYGFAGEVELIGEGVATVTITARLSAQD